MSNVTLQEQVDNLAEHINFIRSKISKLEEE